MDGWVGVCLCRLEECVCVCRWMDGWLGCVWEGECVGESAWVRVCVWVEGCVIGDVQKGKKFPDNGYSHFLSADALNEQILFPFSPYFLSSLFTSFSTYFCQLPLSLSLFPPGRLCPKPLEGKPPQAVVRPCPGQQQFTAIQSTWTIHPLHPKQTCEWY